VKSGRRRKGKQDKGVIDLTKDKESHPKRNKNKSLWLSTLINYSLNESKNQENTKE
jgi:hypothetical protein